ncbi:MAG TPA: N-acetyltransferase [Coleofasciculaceae cyanobacterium]|jgi:putative acetyltransferase
MLSFARETDDDITTIRQVVTAAFGRTSEAELVEAIRNCENFIPELSLVAAEDGNVLGHILFSPIVIEAQGQTIPALALAPLAITPIRQRQGIGSQLVQAGLTKCRELGHGIVVVLGEPHYYRRFGFQTAKEFGVQVPFLIPDEVFMVLELQPGTLMNVTGTVRYPAYFDGV